MAQGKELLCLTYLEAVSPRSMCLGWASSGTSLLYCRLFPYMVFLYISISLLALLRIRTIDQVYHTPTIMPSFKLLLPPEVHVSKCSVFVS